MPLRIGIDIDGVLADFRAAFRATALRCLRREVDDTQDPEVPLSADDVRRVWDHIGRTSNWWLDVPAYEPDQIARLYSAARAANWEIFFMTKRPPSAGDSVQFQTQWWIERFGFYLPAVMTVNGSDVAAPVLSTGLVDVKAAAPEQAVSAGGNRRKVIVPVGRTLLVIVAASEIAPPTVTGADACVVRAGDALVTTTDSFEALQAAVTAALLASPE